MKSSSRKRKPRPKPRLRFVIRCGRSASPRVASTRPTLSDPRYRFRQGTPARLPRWGPRNRVGTVPPPLQEHLHRNLVVVLASDLDLPCKVAAWHETHSRSEERRVGNE